jgi:hypothetical protein
METTMQLIVDRQGGVHGIYDEAIDLALLGELMIRRASYVEPDATGRWTVDLAPVTGPRLGPFSRRMDALAAERSWLEQHGQTLLPASIQPLTQEPTS